MYTVYGPVTGDCGHEHPTYGEASRCLEAHRLAVRRGNPGAYSDRRVYDSASAPRNLVGDVMRVTGAPAERPEGLAETLIAQVSKSMGYLPAHTRRSVALDMTLREDERLRDASNVLARATRAYDDAQIAHNAACVERDAAAPNHLWEPVRYERASEAIEVAWAALEPLAKLRDDASAAYKQAYNAVIADFDAAWATFGAQVAQ